MLRDYYGKSAGLRGNFYVPSWRQCLFFLSSDSLLFVLFATLINSSVLCYSIVPTLYFLHYDTEFHPGRRWMGLPSSRVAGVFENAPTRLSMKARKWQTKYDRGNTTPPRFGPSWTNIKYLNNNNSGSCADKCEHRKMWIGWLCSCFGS